MLLSHEPEQRTERPTPERVGGFEFTVRPAEPTPDGRARWAARADALASWLLAEWRRETAGEAA